MEIYRGFFKDDEFSGKGRLFCEKSEILKESFDFSNFEKIGFFWVFYNGEFLNGKKHGFGWILLSNGEKFEGEFKEDRVEGKGKFYKSDGKVVEGVWKEDKMVGGSFV